MGRFDKDGERGGEEWGRSGEGKRVTVFSCRIVRARTKKTEKKRKSMEKQATVLTYNESVCFTDLGNSSGASLVCITVKALAERKGL